MKNPISFMGANFFARELNYQITGGWMTGDSATQEYFRPIETFASRFDLMLDEIVAAGFSSLDLWSAHLHPDWATEAHLKRAQAALSVRGLTVTSLAAVIPEDSAGQDRLARIAKSVGTRLIGGGCAEALLDKKRTDFIEFLNKHDLIYGFENHPEKTPEAVMEKIGKKEGGRIGVAADTGWFASQGVDAATALYILRGRLVHVHLKDVHEPRKKKEEHREDDTEDPRTGTACTLKDMGHETCALGDGILPVRRCLAVLKEIGYAGGLSVEHEPENRSPVNDARISLDRLHSWMKELS